MAKKFDTNPLDPTFPEKVKEKERAKKKTTKPLGGKNGRTAHFADPVVTEEQTRKFDEDEFGAFDPAFGSEYREPSPLYRPEPEQDEKRSLKIGNISLPENVLTMLPYIPISLIGIVAGILELVFIPKSEPKVRYHAAQGLAAHIAIYIVMAVLGVVSWGSDLASTANDIFWIVTTIILIVFAFKAWQGRPIHIQSVESLTDWLEEKIKPQN